MNNETEKKYEVKKKEKNQVNLNEYFKFVLIF